MARSSGTHVLHIPGDATRREYAVYLMVVVERATRRLHSVYVGKTGDNREGCNPIVSRVGNHLSFNKLHSQTRNRIISTEDHDYRIFYAFFGPYVAPSTSRDGIDIVNEMERELNRRACAVFGTAVANPYRGAARLRADERALRASFQTPERLRSLMELVSRAKRFVGTLTPSSQRTKA